MTRGDPDPNDGMVDGAADNPFTELDDDDRTVVLPRPAALRALVTGPAPTADVDTMADTAFAELPLVRGAPVVVAAAALLALLARLRNVVTVPDPAGLRERAVHEVRRYEQALRDARVPIEQIRTSHYALCASLDDIVQNTPWGSHGPWADASLVSTFHQEVRSGDRFFGLLAQLSRNPGQFLPVIELMYLCMSLGMQGRYRLSARGPAELDRLREETYLVILRQRGAAERELSPHWRGLARPYRPLRFEPPVWLAALLAAAALGLASMLVVLGLNSDSDRSFEASLALPPATLPTIARTGPARPLAAAPGPAGPRDALAEALGAELRDGRVSILGTQSAPVLRIQSAGMFGSGSATLELGFLPILRRVAAALADQPGPVRVAGYTDSQPIHTVAFPSNYQLSLARARATGAVLRDAVGPGRVSEEGRADADPIASNANAAGRAQNRRIDIVLGAAP